MAVPVRKFAQPLARRLLSDLDLSVEALTHLLDLAQQIKRTHIEGAPTLAVEITSPTSTTRDRLLKLDLYARHGAR